LATSSTSQLEEESAQVNIFPLFERADDDHHGRMNVDDLVEYYLGGGFPIGTSFEVISLLFDFR